MIANPAYVRKVMGELKAKKRFGQNFLIDDNIVDKIARIACDSDLMTIEIGPGLGALSEKLLLYSKSVEAYEIDEDMYERLLDNIHDERLKVYHQDFLEADLGIYSDKINVCGNLPYYVTTPILFKLIESDLKMNRLTVMVQKEVGERLGAKANDEEYGALSIEIQYLYDVRQEMNVSRQVFYPAPKVDSIVVSLTPREGVKKDPDFFHFVKDCFRMRRKTLYNNLKDQYPGEKILQVFADLGIPEKIRAQQLALNELKQLHEAFKEE